MNRILQHIYLGGFSTALIAFVYWLLSPAATLFLLSMSTAYAGLFLLSLTLVIGPINLIRKKNNPISSYLRRDIGIWAGIVSILHVIFGLQRHFGGKIWLYFVQESQWGYIPFIKPMGLANYAGLVLTILIIVLLVLSSNAMFKKLGAVKWKKLQRYNYYIFGLLIAHGFLYQLAIKRPLPFVTVVAFFLVFVLYFQWKGYKIQSGKDSK